MSRLAAPTSAPPVVTSATLVIETPEGAIEPQPLTRDDLTIGRDARCDVHIDHPTVSRLHARLWRESDGWHFQDLGSQNGSRLNAAFLATPAALANGVELHIGRVRAWFFGSGVPESWRPSAEDAEHAGRLIRCRCGRIGWVPDHAAGMRLTCIACGRDLVIRDRPPVAPALPPAPPIAPTTTVKHDMVECAACHSPIQSAEPMTTCPDCGAQMHADCWRENGGCATYGCSQVGTLEPDAATMSPDAAPVADRVDGPTPTDGVEDDVDVPAPSSSHPIPLYAAQMILVALVGIPTFGVPAIAYGAYRAVATDKDGLPTPKRVGYVVASFLAGAAGFIASAYWWFGAVG